MTETRVVLVKPGDVLIFGNVGNFDSSIADRFGDLKDLLGLKQIVIFTEDIDLAAIPGDGA
jgi:hypothetical protein